MAFELDSYLFRVKEAEEGLATLQNLEFSKIFSSVISVVDGFTNKGLKVNDKLIKGESAFRTRATERMARQEKTAHLIELERKKLADEKESKARIERALAGSEAKIMSTEAYIKSLEEDEENLKKEGAEDPWHVEKLPLQAEKADLTAQKTNLSFPLLKKGEKIFTGERFRQVAELKKRVLSAPWYQDFLEKDEKLKANKQEIKSLVSKITSMVMRIKGLPIEGDEEINQFIASQEEAQGSAENGVIADDENEEEGDGANEGNGDTEGDDGVNQGDQRNEGNEGNEGNESDEGNGGNQGDQLNGGNEGNEGNEGDEGNGGNEGDEGDEEVDDESLAQNSFDGMAEEIGTPPTPSTPQAGVEEQSAGGEEERSPGIQEQEIMNVAGALDQGQGREQEINPGAQPSSVGTEQSGDNAGAPELSSEGANEVPLCESELTEEQLIEVIIEASRKTDNLITNQASSANTLPTEADIAGPSSGLSIPQGDSQDGFSQDGDEIMNGIQSQSDGESTGDDDGDEDTVFVPISTSSRASSRCSSSAHSSSHETSIEDREKEEEDKRKEHGKKRKNLLDLDVETPSKIEKLGEDIVRKAMSKRKEEKVAATGKENMKPKANKDLWGKGKSHARPIGLKVNLE